MTANSSSWSAILAQFAKKIHVWQLERPHPPLDEVESSWKIKSRWLRSVLVVLLHKCKSSVSAVKLIDELTKRRERFPMKNLQSILHQTVAVDVSAKQAYKEAEEHFKSSMPALACLHKFLEIYSKHRHGSNIVNAKASNERTLALEKIVASTKAENADLHEGVQNLID